MRIVVNAGQSEAEHLEELLSITGDVGEFCLVFSRNLGPDFRALDLHIVLHFQVIDPDATGVIELQVRALIKTFSEQSLHLLNTALMRALGFHDFVEDRNVERHNGNGGAGL
jgi:hypothetical protein